MDLRSPFLLLGRHPGTAALLVLEIAMGFALLLMAWQAWGRYRIALSAPSGIADAELLAILPIGKAGAAAIDPDGLAKLLRRIPGVRQTGYSNQIPYAMNSWNSTVSAQPEMGRSRPIASLYFTSGSWPRTTGLRLSQGRWPAPGEYASLRNPPTRTTPAPLPVVMTSALAQRLYPDGSALGRRLYGLPYTLRVVGIVERMPLPQGSRGRAVESFALLLPLKPDDAAWSFFLIRTAPAQRAEVASAVHATLTRHLPGHAIARPVELTTLRQASFRDSHRWAWTLSACAAAWWLMTLLSLTAAENLWVQQNALRISLHRAIGATRRQVMRIVRLESLLLASAGILAGIALVRFVVPRLPEPWASAPVPLHGLALAALAVCLAIQWVATWPAHRAGDVAPHRVTRMPWVRL